MAAPAAPAIEAPNDPHRLARLWQAQTIAHPEGARLRYYHQEFWAWKDTHWQAVPDAEIRCWLTAFCKTQLDLDYAKIVAEWESEAPPPKVPPITKALVENVLQALGGDLLLPGDTPLGVWLGDGDPAVRNYLSLGNGLLDVDALLAGREGVLLPHSPRWFSPVRLPYDFDPSADCPQWRKFLARNLGDDPAKAALLQQWTGYLLLPDTSLQRFLMMVGEGANGKSVACAATEALLGADNVSSVPLELFGQKFQLTETLSKVANIVAEVGELDKVAEGQLKAYVVGDPIQFERKFKTLFSAKPTARLMLATNNPPRFSDRSDGIWRRILPLHFAIQIPPEERIAGMDKPAYWYAAGEVPGILNWALAGLHSLRTARGFTIPKGCEAYATKLRSEANPARRYLAEHYQYGPDEFLCEHLYQEYSDWCRRYGHYPLSETEMGKEVARLFPKVVKRRLGQRGARYHAYCGLSRRDD
jgi:P4 family phage/plasmid primase-like protien